MINGLDLFSGIGGLTLALKEWVRPVAYCESDPYCQAVLLSRMSKSDIGIAPIWEDVRSLQKTDLRYFEIDIIYGGFPCQDISVAGTGKGLEGERSGLFFEIIRLVGDLRPRFVFLENVPAITTRGGLRVISEFTAIRYDCRWTMVSASELGAPHIRRRWFLLAYSDNGRKRRGISTRRNKSKKMVIDSASPGLQGWTEPSSAWTALREFASTGEFSGLYGFPKPTIHRNDDGIRNRVDRTRALGNAVVPIQAKEAFKRLIGKED